MEIALKNILWFSRKHIYWITIDHLILSSTASNHTLPIAVNHTVTAAQDMEHQPVTVRIHHHSKHINWLYSSTFQPCVQELHRAQMEALVLHPTPVCAKLDGVVPHVQQVQINDFTKLFSQHSMILDKHAWSVCSSALLAQAWRKRELKKMAITWRSFSRSWPRTFTATIWVGGT